jgi:hypothetical protein
MRPWVSRMVGAVAAVSAVACAGAAAAPAAASAATPDYWRVVHRVSMPKSNIVAAVSADSAKDAWAVGALDQATPGYVLHWNGLRWRRVTTPELLRPSGVIAISPANVWLIDGNDEALHDTGHAWTEIDFPEFFGAVGGATASELWLYSGPKASGKHWKTQVTVLRGTTWSTYTLPIQISGFSVRSNGDAVAVGMTETSASNGRGKLAAYRWNGTRWARFAVPALDGPASVTVSSAASIWLAAHGTQTFPVTTVLAHWNGHHWTRIAVPAADGGGFPPPAPVAYGAGAWLGPDARWTGSSWVSPRTDLPKGCQAGSIISIAAVPHSAGLWGAMYCEGPDGGKQSGAIAEYGSVR